MIRTCERCGRHFATEDAKCFDGDAKICRLKNFDQIRAGISLYPVPAYTGNPVMNQMGELQYEPCILCDACLLEFRQWFYHGSTDKQNK